MLIFAAMLAVHVFESRIAAAKDEVVQLREQASRPLVTLAPTNVEKMQEIFALPLVSEAVVRDIAAFGVDSNVELTGIQIDNQRGSASDFAVVLYHLQGKGEYVKTKAWLARLLARYDSLAIKSLSFTTLTNESSRQDFKLTLTLYVRD